MAPPNRNFTNLTSKSTRQSPTSSGPPGLTSSRKAGPPPSSGKSRNEILKDLNREITRSTFFDNRPDISDDRLRRRQAQADEYQAFKNDPTKTKLVEGSTNLFQAATSGGKTLAQKEQELALKYGPTFSEIASDVSYAGGKVIGALGEKAMSGSLGIFGIVKEVANYAADKASGAYNNLTDVQKEIADNPNRYTFAEQQEKVRQLKNFRDLQSQAERDALGLRLDALQEASAQDASGIPAIGGGGGFDEQPSDLFGRGSLPVPKISIEELGYVESGDFREDLQKSGIITVDDSATQEPLSDRTVIPGEEQFGTTIGDLKRVLKDQGFNDLQIQSAVNQVTQQILSGNFTGDVEVETGSTTRGSELQANEPGGKPGGGLIMPTDQSGSLTDMLENSQVSVTEYNNPVNLMDVGQAGATGETYGKGFAVFPDAQTGIMAAKNDLAIKTERYGGNVDKIIGEFSPRSDNPDSFDNYVNFVKQGVGDTVDPGEEDELLRRVIQFENKPDIAQQYLAMVAEGGLMDKKMYGGIISSK